jgi:hypothetical protein
MLEKQIAELRRCDALWLPPLLFDVPPEDPRIRAHQAIGREIDSDPEDRICEARVPALKVRHLIERAERAPVLDRFGRATGLRKSGSRRMRCGLGLDFRDQLFRARAPARRSRSEALVAAVSTPRWHFSSASVGAVSGK